MSKFMSIRVTGIDANVTGLEIDNALREMMSEYKKVQVSTVRKMEGRDRMAYINFQSTEDAENAMRKHSSLRLFGKPVKLSPVIKVKPQFENDRTSPPRQGRGGGRGGRGFRGGNFNQDRGSFRSNPYRGDNVAPRGKNGKRQPGRTLFVGKLDFNVTKGELEDVFQKFGIIEDIAIHHPNPTASYAFIKFFNLNMSTRALRAMTGKTVGSARVTLGYANTAPSKYLWIGRIGPWTDHNQLKREFEKFGEIKAFEWPHGKNYAYVEYDSVQNASEAMKELQGFPLGRPPKSLIIDYSDSRQMNSSLNYESFALDGDDNHSDEDDDQNQLSPDRGANWSPNVYNDELEEDRIFDRDDRNAEGFNRNIIPLSEVEPLFRQSPGRHLHESFDDHNRKRKVSLTPERRIRPRLGSGSWDPKSNFNTIDGGSSRRFDRRAEGGSSERNVDQSFRDRIGRDLDFNLDGNIHALNGPLEGQASLIMADLLKILDKPVDSNFDTSRERGEVDVVSPDLWQDLENRQKAEYERHETKNRFERDRRDDGNRFEKDRREDGRDRDDGRNFRDGRNRGFDRGNRFSGRGGEQGMGRGHQNFERERENMNFDMDRRVPNRDGRDFDRSQRGRGNGRDYREMDRNLRGGSRDSRDTGRRRRSISRDRRDRDRRSSSRDRKAFGRNRSRSRDRRNVDRRHRSGSNHRVAGRSRRSISTGSRERSRRSGSRDRRNTGRKHRSTSWGSSDMDETIGNRDAARANISDDRSIFIQPNQTTLESQMPPMFDNSMPQPRGSLLVNPSLLQPNVFPPLNRPPPPIFHPAVPMPNMVVPMPNPSYPNANTFPMFAPPNSLVSFPPQMRQQSPMNYFPRPQLNQQAVGYSQFSDTRLPQKQQNANSNLELLKKFPAVWSGAIILKNGAYVTNMYLVSGSIPLVDVMLHDPSTSECPVLKITQRLRLDLPEKLQELCRRVDAAGRNGCSVLLAAPASAEVGDVNNVIQQKPLSSLSEFLQEKQLAAVIPLPPGCNAGSEKGILHAFPKCEFASEFLKKEAPELAEKYQQNDHLLIIIMRESNTTVI